METQDIRKNNNKDNSKEPSENMELKYSIYRKGIDELKNKLIEIVQTKRDRKVIRGQRRERTQPL